MKDAVSHKPGLVQQVMPYAERLIHEKLADICLTLDPKDWFDLREPVHNTIYVDLPPTARAKYKELEKVPFLRLDTGEEVEVFNAAALTLKCLQLANGAVYLEDGETWRVLHDEKLDALASLADETGEPILVPYHFKSDLARLLARFPHDGIDCPPAPAWPPPRRARAACGSATPPAWAMASTGCRSTAARWRCSATGGTWSSTTRSSSASDRCASTRPARTGPCSFTRSSRARRSTRWWSRAAPVSAACRMR